MNSNKSRPYGGADGRVHTGFNVFTALLFIPFVKQFARFVIWLMPAKPQTEDAE